MQLANYFSIQVLRDGEWTEEGSTLYADRINELIPRAFGNAVQPKVRVVNIVRTLVQEIG